MQFLFILVFSRLRTGSLDISTMNGIDQLKIDQLKQEILSEIRKEITKMKSEIIDGMCWHELLLISTIVLFSCNTKTVS